MPKHRAKYDADSELDWDSSDDEGELRLTYHFVAVTDSFGLQYPPIQTYTTFPLRYGSMRSLQSFLSGVSLQWFVRRHSLAQLCPCRD